jgi:hypothetical protein
MKPNRFPLKSIVTIHTTLFLLLAGSLRAQICQNPLDFVYALNTKGVLYPVNINDASVGTNLPPLITSDTAINSNGLGFNQLNGKFYYFHRSQATPAPDRQFVSYDPATSTLQLLANFPSANKIRSGCVNNTGTGYYTIDPATGPTLYYYDIAGNTWSAITTSFRDTLGATIGTFATLNSGDMAFDGSGNLWMLLSSGSTYALYKINAPVATTAQAFVTAIQIIAPTPTPEAKSIVGLAFNAAGNLYLSTGTGNNKLYMLESTSSSLTYIGTFAVDDIGADLTSCSFPSFVLNVNTVHLTAALHKNIQLTWTTTREDAGLSGYYVEYSTDARHWERLAFIEKNNPASSSSPAYHYEHGQYALANNYYRIVQTYASGKQYISGIKRITVNATRHLFVSPNPVTDKLTLFNKDNTIKYLAQVYDKSGRLVHTVTVAQAQQSIPISHLPKGTYIIKLTSAVNESLSCRFMKW